MKDSNAPPLARFIPQPAGRAPVVTAVMPPGKPEGSTAVTSFYPGFDTFSPGCSVAVFRRQAAVFYISQIRQRQYDLTTSELKKNRPQDLTTSKDVLLLMPTGR